MKQLLLRIVFIISVKSPFHNENQTIKNARTTQILLDLNLFSNPSNLNVTHLFSYTYS